MLVDMRALLRCPQAEAIGCAGHWRRATRGGASRSPWSPYSRGVASAKKYAVVWVARADAEQLDDNQLRWRAGIEDVDVEVRTERVAGLAGVTIPAGSRDEAGRVVPLMNVSSSVLGPEGRVFVVESE